MDMKRIGKNIKEYRQKLDMTQGNLAEILGCSDTHISHIETGTGSMSLDTFFEMSNALETTPDYIAFGNYNVTLNRAAEMFMEKAKDLTPDEMEYVFGFIDSLEGYRVTRA